MCASLEPLGDKLNLLLNSTNRIRFLKKRQLANQQQLTKHLAQLKDRILPQRGDKMKEEEGGSSERDIKRGEKGGGQDMGERQSFTRVNTSRRKFKISGGIGRYAVQTTQEDSSLIRSNQNQESITRSHPSLLRRNRQEQIAEERANNYRLMKQREQELQLFIRLKSEENQRRLRERVAQAAQRKQQGRRKIQDNYFEHIENVQAEKGKERDRKNRITEKRMQQMIRLQQEEKAHIDLFQSSLALEEHLKSFLQEKIPLGNPAKSASMQLRHIFP